MLFLFGPGQALHMSFGLDLSTRLTTKKVRGRISFSSNEVRGRLKRRLDLQGEGPFFLSYWLPVLLLLVRSKGLRGRPFLTLQLPVISAFFYRKRVSENLKGS